MLTRGLCCFSFAFLIISGSPASAQSKLKVCKKGNSVFAAKKCGKNGQALDITTLTGAAGATGATGEAGAAGASGADGILGVYGDGSAGPLSVTSNTSWYTSPPTNNNLQFTTCTVATGTTLTIPSGTVLRCRGAVDIAGTITVVAPRNGGQANRGGTASESLVPSYVQAGAGISPRSAGPGEVGKVNAGLNSLSGGYGGDGVSGGLTDDPARFLGSLLRGEHLSGGGGAAVIGEGGFGLGVESGGGGGSFSIISMSTITISGTINADAGFGLCITGGCGGGGGGIVVLAAKTSIAFSGSGSITARGGNGADAGASTGAGGAGGGGIIQYLSPSVPTISGTNSVVTAGTSGATPNNGVTSATIRQAGGGGGGCGGLGATGGTVPETTGAQTANPVFVGGPGIALGIAVDPSALLL